MIILSLNLLQRVSDVFKSSLNRQNTQIVTITYFKTLQISCSFILFNFVLSNSAFFLTWVECGLIHLVELLNMFLSKNNIFKITCCSYKQLLTIYLLLKFKNLTSFVCFHNQNLIPSYRS